MRFLKRLVVWFLETVCEALILSIALMVIIPLTSSQHGYATDIMIMSILIVVVFMWGTGYILTTAIVRIFWNGRSLWLYPVIATTLFLIHAEIFIRSADVTVHRQVWAAGACICFASTFVGSWILRKWRATGTPLIS
jgi:hypothetical protein